MQRAAHFFLACAAVVHAKLAVGRRIPGVGRIAKYRVIDAHLVEHLANHRHVADDEAVEAADEIDLAVHLLAPAGCLLLDREEVRHDALERVVVSGDVRTDEGRRMSERHVEFVRYRALLFGGLDEGVEIVADHFRHAGGRHRDHFRLVQIVGVGQAVDHVVEAAEHRCILGHRRRDARGRFFEMARKMRPIVGHATLRAMHERQGTLEAIGGKYRPERLTGLGRIDSQRLALEVQGLVLGRLGPLVDFRDLPVRVLELELGPFPVEHLRVFGLTEQHFVVDDLFGTLRHLHSPEWGEG